MKRREFLSSLGAGLVVGALPPSVVSGADVSTAADNDAASSLVILTDTEQATLHAVMDELLPAAPDSPSARDVMAAEYLQRMMSDPTLTPSEQRFLRNGLQWLNELSERTAQSLPFGKLSPKTRGEVLKAFSETERGENWISTTLRFTLEALFGDPVYGVNTNEVGWRWIGHRPGFPRPPVPAAVERPRRKPVGDKKRTQKGL